MTATSSPTPKWSSAAVHLPTTEERPDADVVIFDGHCRFCRGQVERLARWDTRDRLAFLSLHDPEANRLCPDLSHEQLLEQMYVIDRQGNRYGGAAAFRYLTRRLPRLWPLVPFLHLPGTLPIWQWGYRQVAKNRYWFGKTTECDDDRCKVHFR